MYIIGLREVRLAVRGRTLASLVSAVALALALSGCATSRNPQDPLEGFNRAMSGLNDSVGRNAIKPASTAYQSTVPAFLQTGIGNFFGNLGDAWSAVNNLLQGKARAGLSDVMRVSVNSTLGLFGLLDIGSPAGLAKHREDFGQTLGRWGVPPGPYLVLPLFGPSTLRDTMAAPVDRWGDPWRQVYPLSCRNAGTALRLLGQRAALPTGVPLEMAVLDSYESVRDAYLQRRQDRINDREYTD